MPTQSIRWGSGRPLVAVFAALLAGCTGREVPEETAGQSEGGTGETDSTSGSSDPTTVSASDPTTTSASGTSATGTDSGSGSATSTDTTPPETTDDSYEPPECVYDHHVFELTPEQYQAWLDGEGQVGTTGTTGDSTTGDGTTSGGSTAGGEEGGSTAGGDEGGSTASGGGETDGTGGEWSMELCVEICVALTMTSEWDIDSCSKEEMLTPEGNVVIRCTEIVEHCDGRSHACIASRGAVAEADPVGGWFARAAHDEAASVYAFAALAGELAQLGAPAPLLARLRSAAADEVRHARAISQLAARRGARCRAPERREFPTRSAREIAVENAVEGCVRETWAAMVAHHQAARAADPEIRRAFATIAADEARHGELAFAIDAWLADRLTPAERDTVAAARDAAIAGLLDAPDTTSASVAAIAGLPDAARARSLASALVRELWAS
jgi:hypothetical protein